MSESPNLGQGALNRMATAALQSQFDEADNLSVEVETSPSALSKGEVDAMTIDGEGVSLADQVETAEMHIQANAIQVNPFKAMFGNIVLKNDIDAIAALSFSADDIAAAINTNDFRGSLPLAAENNKAGAVAIDCFSVSFETGSIAIKADFSARNQAEPGRFNLTPVVSDQQQVQFVLQGKVDSEVLASAIADNLAALFDINQFEISGAALRLAGVAIDSDRFVMQLKAEISELSPS